jgi:hypothetical protein
MHPTVRAVARKAKGEASGRSRAAGRADWVGVMAQLPARAADLAFEDEDLMTEASTSAHSLSSEWRQVSRASGKMGQGIQQAARHDGGAWHAECGT